jgi:hypothetical protein
LQLLLHPFRIQAECPEWMRSTFGLLIAPVYRMLVNRHFDNVAGYTVQLLQHSQAIFTKEWQWAKRPQDGSETPRWRSSTTVRRALPATVVAPGFRRS